MTSSPIFVLLYTGGFSDFCLFWSGRGIDFFSKCFCLTWHRCTSMFIWTTSYPFHGSYNTEDDYDIFCKVVPKLGQYLPLSRYEFLLYPVLVSQLPRYSMDVTKNHPNLSYFANWSSYFLVLVMSLEYFYLDGNISPL